MRLSSRNFCGLRNSHGIWSFWELLKWEVPDLVFLQETKVSSSFFSIKKFSLGFKHGLAVDCMCRSGGLVLFWKEDVNFEILSYSSNFNHGVLHIEDGRGHNCLVTGVYGPPKFSRIN